MRVFIRILFFMGWVITLTSCGLKAPPSPPLPSTPQQSEVERPRRLPSPSPSPSPSKEVLSEDSY